MSTDSGSLNRVLLVPAPGVRDFRIGLVRCSYSIDMLCATPGLSSGAENTVGQVNRRTRPFGSVGRLSCFVVMTFVWLAAGATAWADEFKVENSVYAGDEKEPSSRSTTYFTGGAVYDCMKDPAEVAIFEKAEGKFILVDIRRRLRTELSTKEIASRIQQLQQLAAKNPDPVVKFSAQPSFDERYDESAKELTLSSQWITYRTALTPEANQEAVEQYREFCDWNARLNALLKPAGSLLPFARLEVDNAIARRQALPSQVGLTINSSKSGHPAVAMQTAHRVVRPLTSADLEYVTKLRGALKEFNLVDFDRYRKPDKAK